MRSPENPRFFVPPPISATSQPQEDNYANAIETLFSRCLQYYAPQQHQSNYYRGTLYHGGLGLATFLRWKMALWFRPTDDSSSISSSQCRRQELLQSALNATDLWLSNANSSSHSSISRHQRCTLLESPTIGALAMKTAILHSMGRSSSDEVQKTATRLEQTLTAATAQLAPGECEVLYGRAGSLHAILFVRTYGGLPNFGQHLVPRLLQEILQEGTKNSTASLVLMWSWHGKAYLGAAHGVAGILHTLLHFVPELQRLGVESSQHDEHYFLNLIQQTLHGLNQQTYCFESGNLASSVGSSTDRLVQWCHGAPGHVLLLVKASEIFPDYRQQYLNRAKTICETVIVQRGLLRKGLGLCHGIAGNAYCFLAVYRAVSQDGDDDSSRETKQNMLEKARAFARFGLNHLAELETRPDNPYSLYEGMAGFVSLLIDLHGDSNPDRSFFPCYEYV